MDFFTNKIRVSQSAYKRDRVNPITGDPMPTVKFPQQKSASVSALKTVQGLLNDPPSAFNEILQENRPTGTRKSPRFNCLSNSPDHDQGASGEGFQQTEPEQVAKSEMGWTANSVRMQTPLSKSMNPIPQDSNLQSAYHSKLTNKVTDDMTGSDSMPLEERLARIQMKSLRPQPTPPSPYRVGRIHDPKNNKHALETPWDLLTDESIKRVDPSRTFAEPSKDLVDQKIGNLMERFTKSDEGKGHDSLILGLNRSWEEPAYSALQQEKKRFKEDMLRNKVKTIVEDIIMVNQLSRSGINPPEQTEGPGNFVEPLYRPGTLKRGTIRTLHEATVTGPGACSEKCLTKGRVYFCARILTRNSREAIRDITGFYFTVDNSLTLYEHRQFTSKSTVTALPFIKRLVYPHIHGCRKGTPYTITDIVQGNDLEIKTEDQPIPDSMKQRTHAVFRITEVDNETKAKILLDGLPAISRDDMWKKLHLPPTEGDVQLCRLQKDMQDFIQSQIRDCGVRIWRNMGKVWHQLDSDDNGYLSRYELEKTLAMFNIEVPAQMFHTLWSFIDEDNLGNMEYDKFRRIFMGEMSEPRKAEMKKAYRKMDFNKKGLINVSDMQKFYNAYKHPSVVKGKCSEEKVLEVFFAYFADTVNKGQVTFSEFEEYYEGLSLAIEQDEHFINILQNSWSI